MIGKKNLKPRSSLSRKIATIVFLPVILAVWMVGWSLTQLGNPNGSIEINSNIQFRKVSRIEKKVLA